jgi:dihydroxy-acid dehydratase
MADFYEAGGVQVVMRELEPFLHGSCVNVTGRTVAETLRDCPGSARPEVIRTTSKPFAPTGGVAVLQGSLAPLGAVAKPAAIPEQLMRIQGRAQVFHSEQEACEAILKGRVEPGRVVVLRYEGPKGGPGMPEMYRPMKCLEGMGLSDTCALITDGRFSGSNRGCFVGHISPEAYEGGTLALVEDGDEILIDVPGRRLELMVDGMVLEQRRRRWTRPEKDVPDGYLNVYRALSRSAAQGAVLGLD